MRVRKGLFLAGLLLAGSALGATVNLGTASSFGMLGSTISNTGSSVVTGNVGATTTIGGFPPGTASGTVYGAPSDPTVAAAYTDFLAAYSTAYSDVLTVPTMTFI